MKLFDIFKRSGEPLAVSMAGIKMGDRLLVLGCADPVRLAQLAVKTGLTGRACAIDAREAVTARAAEIAAREGALIEAFTAPWGALPLDAESFDVAVIDSVLAGLDAAERIACVVDVHRVLRPGGRCLVIDPGRRAGLGGLVQRPASDSDTGYVSRGGAVAALESGGFRAARLLAERDGLAFAEGIKGNI
jgi:ubiquinone/menaquinone biosynthesis C-methylase UbiE